MPGKIGKNQIYTTADHCRPCGKSIESIGKIHRIRCPDYDQYQENQIPNTEIGPDILQKRDTKLTVKIRMTVEYRPGNTCAEDLQNDLPAST